MKLKRLWINDFKNLNDFEFDFTDKDGITVLIGNNGSGKSNVLEAISAIFTGLLKMSTPQRKPNFEYEIEYELVEGEHYHLSLMKHGDEYRYNFHKNLIHIPTATFKASPYSYLPSNIIAIYSGEEMRLWENYYKYLYSDFMKEVREDFQSFPQQRLIYLNKYFWNISLLSLLYSDLEDNKNFCMKILKMYDLDNIEIKLKFNRNNLDNFNGNSIISFIESLNPLNEDQKNLTIDELKVNQLIGNERELFFKLMAAVMNKESKYKLIDKITINFQNGLNIEDLSEGEKKQILIRTGLEIIANDNSLILFDEPDSHIHVANKVQIKNMLEEYRNRESILTTHSPSLTHAFDDKHITMINEGKIEDKTKQEVFSHITDGIWNYQEQSVFLSSNKEVILLVEGQHDKIHIEEAFNRLKEEYQNLDFDVFQMNGESNIKHMMLGLMNNGVDFSDKKIIAIFDNDVAGQKGFNSNFKKIEDKTYKQLIDNGGNPSNIFFGFMLPKTDNFRSNFTIENMYKGVKYKDALLSVFNKRNEDDEFFNDFVDDVSEQIKLDAKNKLADNCKEFDNEDFEHFKKLFDLIVEIKELP